MGAAQLDEHRSSQSNLTPWLLGLCGLVTLAMIAAARIKGGYIDEYYTMSFADSSVPLHQAFNGWTRDSLHPIGFYAWNRIADLILVPDVFIRRLANLAYFALALIVAWCSGKAHRSFALLFIASVAAVPYVLERFAEYRATFLALMILAMLIVRLRIALVQPPRGRSLILIVALSSLLGLVDYPVTISGIALCGAWGIHALMDRDGHGIRCAMGALAAWCRSFPPSTPAPFRRLAAPMPVMPWRSV